MTKSSRSSGQPKARRVSPLPTPRRTQPAENPLLVFVSSVISGMEAERAAANRAIQSIAFTRPWIFENTPASSQDVTEAYLSKVESCAIFICIIGDNTSPAVEREYDTALAHHKPILVFLRAGARTDETSQFMERIRAHSKYAVYVTPEQLYTEIRSAVFDELVRTFVRAKQDIQALMDQVRPEGAANLGDVLGQVTIGMAPNDLLQNMFGLFGALTRLPMEQDNPDPGFEDVHFGSMASMTATMQSLSLVIDKANSTGGDRSAVLLSELNRHLARKTSQRAVGQPPREGVRNEPPGFKYMVMRIRSDWSAVIRLLRFADGDIDLKNDNPDDTVEVVFQNPLALQAFATAGTRASAEAQSDSTAFLRVMLEEASVFLLNNPSVLHKMTAPRPRFLVVCPSDVRGKQVKAVVTNTLAACGLIDSSLSPAPSKQGSSSDYSMQALQSADIIVVDISRNNPSVFYEAGIAHAIQKRVVLIQDMVSNVQIPSSLVASVVLRYDRSNYTPFVNQLKAMIDGEVKGVVA